MEIQKFKNMQEAFGSILKKDEEFIAVKHSLFKGQGVKRHFHKKATEWLILNSGSLDVRSDDDRGTIISQKEILVVKFMVSVKHSVDALEDSEYFVVRDCQDDTYYSNRLF